jgi:hypothetical protein
MAYGEAKKETWQVAAVIAEMMQRAEQTRGRLSEKLLRKLCGRSRIETSIRNGITGDLLDYGYLLHRLEGRGPTRGHVVIALSALHAAKPLKGLDLYSAEERKAIENGTFDFGSLHDKLMGDPDDLGEE